MYCHILKDKTTNEEYLIPDCWGVVNHWHLTSMTDREIIKEFCTCNRKKREKYETHTRDEVISMIEKTETKINRVKDILLKYEDELDCIKSEVFVLNTEIVK